MAPDNLEVKASHNFGLNAHTLYANFGSNAHSIGNSMILDQMQLAIGMSDPLMDQGDQVDQGD